MADLTAEVFEALPEAVQENYELSGEVYVTKDSLKVGALKNSLNNAYTERDSLLEKEKNSETLKATEIEAAKAEAIKEALASNNHEESTRLLQEKLNDATKRSDEKESAFNKRLESIAEEKKTSIIKSLSPYAIDGAQDAFTALLSPYLVVDKDTGEETYLNEDGSASNLNREQFIETLPERKLLKPLLKLDLPTKGKGLLNGVGDLNNLGSPKVNQAAEAAKKSGDAIGHLNAHFSEAFKL